MRVLLDAGIFIHSEFAAAAVEERLVRWGDSNNLISVYGLRRKAPKQIVDDQKQIEALVTIGRIIREGLIEAYSYNEIQFEHGRGRPKIQSFNALQGCTIHKCRPAIERSKFAASIDFRDVISKGGKKDRKAGVVLGAANQIAVFKMFSALGEEDIRILIERAEDRSLSEFEIESLRTIKWFHFFCQKSANPEYYPDIFHLWTAERNDLEVFLTLDGTFQNFISRVLNEEKRKVDIRTEVMKLLDLLLKLGIDEPDPVPMDADRFYNVHEL